MPRRFPRTSRTPTWAAPSSTSSKPRSASCAPVEYRAISPRSVSVAGAARSSFARSSRPTRSPRRASSPSIASSAPIRPAKTPRSRRYWGGSAPTCTRSLSASSVSVCSTSASISCRATPRRSCAMLPSTVSRWFESARDSVLRSGPVLDAVHERLQPGGAVIVEGTSSVHVEKTALAAHARAKRATTIARVDWSSIAWTVEGTDDEFRDAPPTVANRTGANPATTEQTHRVGTVPPLPSDALDLSVVVVFYNMRREAARTLLSLSRSYQRDIEDLDYEVIVVDNGSDPELRLAEEYVRSFGPHFRYLDLGADAPPSPTVALNRGAAIARGREHRVHDRRRARADARRPEERYDRTRNVRAGDRRDAAVVSSARASRATPCMPATTRKPKTTCSRASAGRSTDTGCSRSGISSATAIGSTASSRATACSSPRELSDRFGAFDDSFAMAGGGYANLDLWERIGASAGVNVASILGEGSFHQVHGGTTTNIANAANRRDLVSSYGVHFRELRGRGLLGITKPVHYVGAMATKAARRTRSRREISLRFDPEAQPGRRRAPAACGGRRRAQARGHRGSLGEPAPGGTRPGSDTASLATRPISTATRSSSRRCVRSSSWLPVTTAASAALRTSSPPSSTRSTASRSTDVEAARRRVIAVGPAPVEDRPAHDRIIHVVGSARLGAGRRRRCARSPGPEPAAAVFLSLGAVARVVAAFEAYAPLVPVGSYFVVENTVVNGRPVALGLRPRPARSGGRHPRPPPRLLRRPDLRALHAHVQPQRLPQAHVR